MSQFGVLLRAERQVRGLAGLIVSEKAGIPYDRLVSLEQGRMHPRRSELPKLMEAIGVTSERWKSVTNHITQYEDEEQPHDEGTEPPGDSSDPDSLVLAPVSANPLPEVKVSPWPGGNFAIGIDNKAIGPSLSSESEAKLIAEWLAFAIGYGHLAVRH